MKTTEEKNRMIAEFMGYKPSKGIYELPFTQWKWMSSVLSGEGIDSTNEFTINEMQFHTSWDWLMPVVERIEDLVLGKENISLGYYNRYLNEDGKDREDFLIFRLPKQATYEAVVEFIEWYNENK